MTEISLIAFDADDTLWGSQTYFNTVEKVYCEILAPYASADEVSHALRITEKANMPLLGYGSKAFMLSLIENAVKVSHGKIKGYDIGQIIDVSKELLRLPGRPFDGVKVTLAKLRDTGRYRMIVFTKGELLDQENKFKRSGLCPYFDDIVIESDKTPDAYQRLCRQFGVKAGQLLTVGDSFSEDVAPALKMGGWGVHIPYYYIGSEDDMYQNNAHPHLLRIAKFAELTKYLCPVPRFVDESQVS
ncbi:HAD family hydrolase [Prevotella fusca]|uniref:HAD family hydrolase n=1 Tax=Prevotella fusca JCM 17724 TaxID=1236517 RepID=A0A0K1NIY6_9BACT|nr:HAD family hydrolase [Prevotella fusca]AKU68853.1 HAD family hydrolase [Prevotella fusca JCM 17724]QUB86472.1 HAD family hydrolase [Prevotella fusca JCM 17724]